MIGFRVQLWLVAARGLRGRVANGSVSSIEATACVRGMSTSRRVGMKVMLLPVLMDSWTASSSLRSSSCLTLVYVHHV